MEKLIKLIKKLYLLKIPMSFTIHFSGDGGIKYDAKLGKLAVDKLIDPIE